MKRAMKKLHSQAGVTLIELMIAVTLSAFLLLGLIQVFSASRLAYQSTTALARVQEGSRFATDFLQRDIRMAGHMGCLNDRSRSRAALAAGSFLDSFFLSNAERSAGTYGGAAFPLRFDMPIQGFEATGTGRGGAVNVSAPATGWLPALDASLTGSTGLSPVPRAGSDILVLRTFSGDSAPLATDILLLNGQPGAVTVASGSSGLIEAGGFYGLASCDRAAVFQARSAPVSGTFSIGNSGSNRANGFQAIAGNLSPPVSKFTATTSQLYRADSYVYYVGNGAGGVPSLFRARFMGQGGGAGAWGASEELVEGVDSMQLFYGLDADNNGAIENYMRADEVAAGVAAYDQVADRWRAVVAVELGLVLRSPERSGTPDRNAASGAVSVVGVRVDSAANESVLRRPYETTIALRNRLFGN